MAKRKNLVVYMYLLALTLIMISISASNPAFVSGEEDCDELDWSISAAEEAEIVDIVSCSGGELNIFEPFWREHARKSSVLVSGWHRMRYNYSDGSSISPLLVKNIRKLHEIVGNAITNERYIVFGSGSTQLINAAVYALSHKSSLLDPAKVLNTSPYCPVEIRTQLFSYEVDI
ncbi:tryptophan aminotransferase-related protein 4-like [Arachis duranensis]|uniref:Tryptophan aminotransferase-related protein 4-like n=1 Tax=Arachis duranensis TaxID=130453 RepID=A0A9C6TPP2_ARADU|nr:tryptophan aminotransferase-related protein 4-like [Arachis duranensis]